MLILLVFVFSNAVAGEGALVRMACGLGGKLVLPMIKEHIMQMLQNRKPLSLSNAAIVERGFPNLKSFFWSFFFFFFLMRPHPRHLEVPRLGVESELQLLTYTTAHSSPLSEAKDQTRILMDTSCSLLWSHNWNSPNLKLFNRCLDCV